MSKSKVSKTRNSAPKSSIMEESTAPVRLEEIQIVDRPGDGEDKLFYNPRREEDFTPESMKELRQSIRMDGLLQDPVVRAIEHHGQISRYELVAGERRKRSLDFIVQENLPCFDRRQPTPEQWQPNMTVIHTGRLGRFAILKQIEGDRGHIQYLDENDHPTDETGEVALAKLRGTFPGAQVYQTISCKILRNCEDQEALRLALAENLQHEGLSVAAQVAVTERLAARGLTQQEIDSAIGKNITWISQTLAFRRDLPPEAFEDLMEGRMMRNVGVSFLGYALEDRPRLYEETVVVAREDIKAKVKAAKLEKELHEDLVHVEETKAVIAKTAGDEKEAEVHKKKLAVEKKKVAAAKAKLAAAKKDQDKGVIQHGHVLKAAANLGVAPKKKSKTLSKPEIEKLIERLELASEGNVIDPETKKIVPANLAAIGAAFLRGVLNGLRDPFAPIREQMGLVGDLDEDVDDDDQDPDDDELGELDDEMSDEDRDAINSYMHPDDE